MVRIVEGVSVAAGQWCSIGLVWKKHFLFWCYWFVRVNEEDELSHFWRLEPAVATQKDRNRGGES